MRAADVVGLNLEAGERVGLGFVAQHEVAVALVGVGFLRVGIDDNQAGEDRLRGAAEGVFVEEIGFGVGRLVNLECTLVEFLTALGDGEGEHLGERAGGLQLRERFVAGLAGAEVDVEGLDAGVAADDGAVGLEGKGAVAPVLFADVGEVCAVAGVEIVGAGGELRLGVVA